MNDQKQLIKVIHKCQMPIELGVLGGDCRPARKNSYLGDEVFKMEFTNEEAEITLWCSMVLPHSSGHVKIEMETASSAGFALPMHVWILSETLVSG